MARKALEVREVSKKQMAEILGNLKGYKGFITLVSETEQNSKLQKPVANFGKGVLISMITRTKLNFGGDYTKKVREITGNAEFQSQKPNGKHHINEYLLQKDSDENVYYFRTYKVKGFSNVLETRYMKNGVLVEDEAEIAKIKSLYRPVAPNPIPVRDYSIDNIISARINRIDYIVRG